MTIWTNMKLVSHAFATFSLRVLGSCLRPVHLTNSLSCLRLASIAQNRILNKQLDVPWSDFIAKCILGQESAAANCLISCRPKDQKNFCNFSQSMSILATSSHNGVASQLSPGVAWKLYPANSSFSRHFIVSCRKESMAWNQDTQATQAAIQCNSNLITPCSLKFKSHANPCQNQILHQPAIELRRVLFLCMLNQYELVR